MKRFAWMMVALLGCLTVACGAEPDEPPPATAPAPERGGFVPEPPAAPAPERGGFVPVEPSLQDLPAPEPPPERGGFVPVEPPTAPAPPPERGGFAPMEPPTAPAPPPERGGFAPERPPVAPGAPASSRGGLAPGSGGLTDRLWEGRAEYSCPGRRGETITIAVSAPGLDPQVWLIDPSGEVEAYDDDSGGGGDSLISGHPLRHTGMYTIRVGSYGNREGEISLSVEGSCYR